MLIYKNKSASEENANYGFLSEADLFVVFYFTLRFNWLLALLGRDFPMRLPVGCTFLPFLRGISRLGFSELLFIFSFCFNGSLHAHQLVRTWSGKGKQIMP
jgi:hypothetical protein